MRLGGLSLVSRLGIFGAGLVLLFGLSLAVGTLVGDRAGDPGSVSAGEGSDDGHGHTTEHVYADPSKPQDDDVAAQVAGVVVSSAGYTLDLTTTSAAAGASVPVSFRVLDAKGAPVTDYDVTHDKDLHLIAVKRDLSGFQHVHPSLAADGTWTVPLALTPGDWRLIADFAPAGHAPVALGADLAVAGTYRPTPLPAASDTATVDGYQVKLGGTLTAGQDATLTLSISRDGKPVTDLQPYLAAYGHLVALRQGDLAYLHVHPEENGKPGPDVVFHTTAPTAGTYRLFLDFQHDGVVRTAAFTVEVR